uniref:pyridoxal 5'-phosphate synthase n=1 Tax=Angiostrongylus cantonensis TaxID=6313 RepID=A0A158PBZ8_ANGCA
MRPSSRMVLLKSYANDTFSFYTNCNSRKGRELHENPSACMLFYWPKVRIEGKVSLLSNEDAVAYWNSRPIAGRIGSKSSEQSEVVPNRDLLTNGTSKMVGYALVPDYFEFWQGQSDRLHDRIEFRKCDGNWKIQRLSP